MQKVSEIVPVLCAGALALTMAWPAGAASAAPALRVPAGERQLLIDDVGIAKITNLKRTLHQPAKKGAVIRPLSGADDSQSIQTRAAPAWNPQRKIWQMWDCSTPNDLHAKHYFCGGYYESTDGVKWTRPVVGQVERHGNRENNYVIIKTGKRWFRPDMAVYDPFETNPARRYKAPIPRIGGLAGGCAVSPDGINWKVESSPGMSTGDEWNFSLDKTSRLFLYTLKIGGPHGRSVGLATSKDFRKWKNHGLIFHADKRDQQLGREHIKARLADKTLHQPVYNNSAKYNVDVYNMGLFRYESLYIGTPAMFHSTGPIPTGNSDGFHLIQLVSSRDLKTFQRVGDRGTFIGGSPEAGGAYDTTQLIGPSDAVVRGDELWFYYTGIKYRALTAGKECPPDRGAICLAVLRRDGFVSLDADASDGILLTQPFAVPRGRLYVNVDAPDGELRIEALDTNGQVLAASAPMKGDLLRGRVKWRKGNAARLNGRTVQLRFTLRNASLYSYWLGR